MKPEWLEQRTILRVEVGSTLHGISVGSDDRDEMGICIEPYELACGLDAPFEHYVYRTATERTGRADEPSQPGDLDLTVYSLRKWMRLASMKGNPNVLLPLFAPHTHIVHCDARGAHLRELAPLFRSKRVGRHFLGYMKGQRQRLVGERGQKDVNRRELVEKFGFDTKYAGHLIRLGIQCCEYLQTGKLTLPMRDDHAELCKAIRRGEWPLELVLSHADALEQEVNQMLASNTLPDEPHTSILETWMLDMYWENWAADRHLRRGGNLRQLAELMNRA